MKKNTFKIMSTFTSILIGITSAISCSPFSKTIAYANETTIKEKDSIVQIQPPVITYYNKPIYGSFPE